MKLNNESHLIIDAVKDDLYSQYGNIASKLIGNLKIKTKTKGESVKEGKFYIEVDYVNDDQVDGMLFGTQTDSQTIFEGYLTKRDLKTLTQRSKEYEFTNNGVVTMKYCIYGEKMNLRSLEHILKEDLEVVDEDKTSRTLQEVTNDDKAREILGEVVDEGPGNIIVALTDAEFLAGV